MRDTTATLVLVLAMAACGPSGRDHGPGGGGPDAPGPGSDPGNGDGCSDDAKLVYTVDQNNTLSKFDPVAKQFTDIGPLNCPATGFGATPFSMGIDRSAAAWVLYSDGELFHVDTTSLACTKTSWSSPNGLMQFGMGFSTDTVGGSTDTLFIAGGSGPTNPTSALNSLDTTSMAPHSLGTIQGWPELTGNGNAELWGWFPDTDGTQTPRVEQLDKTNVHPIKTFQLPALSGMAAAWAFAFFGGDYFVFLMRATDFATTVYQVDGMTGAVKSMTDTQTRTIVGAGVSTCAPVVVF
jgi:hypothetical protein